MLQVRSFIFNPFQENTYIVSNNQDHCWIIDPGMFQQAESEALFQYIQDNNLVPKAIINTHAHIDHILGVTAMQERYGIPFGLHEKELSVLGRASDSAQLFGLRFPEVPKVDFFIAENTLLRLDDDQLEVRSVPGHSPGSILFYSENQNWVISGDVLFYESIGRTDLPGGDTDTLLESIQTQLYSLPENTVVYPGHGSPTTVAHEKQFNPFLKDL